MTKEEFKGFSSAAQHDMVLDALVRITKNLETIEKESGKPFVGTVKQRRNDVKLLTILAEAFGKNELVWKHSESTRYEVKMIPRDEVLSRFALYTGIGQKVYMEKSKPAPWDTAPMIDATNDNRKGSRNTFSEMTNAKEKIESAQQSSGNFMSCKSSTDTTSYPDELVKRS
jgi:hypothetical protein